MSLNCSLGKYQLSIVLCFVFSLSIYLFKHAKPIQPLNTIVKRTTLSPLFPNRTSDLTLSAPLVSGLPLNRTPNEAFVTFSNNKPRYLALLTSVA